jgi:acetylornithine deacetylase/succinyl-diaminopimelate desuccinylase-like protein
MRGLFILTFAMALAGSLASAQTSPAGTAARQWRTQHERAIIDEFIELLSVPNVSSDRDGTRRTAERVVQMFAKRDVAARLVEFPGANPVVLADLKTPGATRTVALYAHYDGQPLDPREWATPPFSPVLRDRALDKDGQVIALPAAGTPFNPEWRLYARSASDDKAPIVAMAAALDALRAAGIARKSNIKLVFEGEEEAGSVNLQKILEANKAAFAADLWIICDGPVHQSRRQQITFGARGDTTVDITLYGPQHELHSGHYGNWAPNPALMLAQLLASMKNDKGRVLIEHFYDGIEPLTAAEKRALTEVPEVDRELMDEFLLGSTEGSPKKLVELITEPALNIRGMASSRTGALASNVIPATATASLDLRPVKGMDHRRTAQLVIDHIRRQGYFIVDREPTAKERKEHAKVARVNEKAGGYNAARTPLDLPIAQDVIRAVEGARGPSVKLPTSGASVPLDMIEKALGTRTISVPIVNHDNNQHSFNENIRIQNLWDGIETMAALLAF